MFLLNGFLPWVAPFFHTSLYVVFSTNFYADTSNIPLSTMMVPLALSLTTNLLQNAAITIVFSFHSALLFRMNGKECQSTHGDINCWVVPPILLMMLIFPCTTSAYSFFLWYAASTIIFSTYSASFSIFNQWNWQPTHGAITFSVSQPFLLTTLTSRNHQISYNLLHMAIYKSHSLSSTCLQASTKHMSKSLSFSWSTGWISKCTTLSATADMMSGIQK